MKVLAAFVKAHDLQPRAEQIVEAKINATGFAVWDEDTYQWVVEAGKYFVQASTSSRDVDVKGTIEVEVKDGWQFEP